MRSVLFSVLLYCFALTNATQPRSVNVALETSLLFEPGEDQNYSFIDKIRHFIDQIEKAITPVKAFLRTSNEKDKIFTEFLRKIFAALLEYDNKDLKEVTKLLSNEVEILFDNTDIFSEDVQRKILETLINHSQMKPNQIRSDLHNILNSNNSLLYESFVKLNKYFNNSDKAKLDDVHEKFATEINLKDTVSNFIHIIHDKYESLNNTDKNNVDEDLNKLFKNFDINLVNSEDINERKDGTLENVSSQTVGENITGSINLNKPDVIFINKDVEVSVRGAKKDEENYSKDSDVDLKVDGNIVEISEDDTNGS